MSDYSRSTSAGGVGSHSPRRSGTLSRNRSSDIRNKSMDEGSALSDLHRKVRVCIVCVRGGGGGGGQMCVCVGVRVCTVCMHAPGCMKDKASASFFFFVVVVIVVWRGGGNCFAAAKMKGSVYY